MFDQALVERAEHRHQQRRQRADRDARAHAARHAADHQRHARQHHQAEREFALGKARARQPRFDHRHEHRAQRHAGRADRGVRQLDRAVEREPVQRHQRADAGVGQHQARRHRPQPAPHARHQRQRGDHDQHAPPHQRQRRQGDQLAEDRGEAPQQHAEMDLQVGLEAVGVMGIRALLPGGRFGGCQANALRSGHARLARISPECAMQQAVAIADGSLRHVRRCDARWHGRRACRRASTVRRAWTPMSTDFIAHLRDLFEPLGPIFGTRDVRWPRSVLRRDHHRHHHRRCALPEGGRADAFALRGGGQPTLHLRHPSGKPLPMSYWSLPEEALDSPQAMLPWATDGDRRRRSASRRPANQSRRKRGG